MSSIEKIEEALAAVAAVHGMEIVDLELVSERSGWVLRLYIDRPGGAGVTVDDCARVSRDCSVTLDAEDLVDRRYRLEVSSPGIERRLRRREHFQQQIGNTIHVVLRQPVEGRRKVTGELTEVGGATIELACQDGSRISVSLDNIKRANLKVY
jgi:ribosome maturation factor RimP